jgi:enamine deaminase RidA (YjgF/YER057c/UK114 family)
MLLLLSPSYVLQPSFTYTDEQYSQAVRAGNYVYTSGSVGMTKEGQMVEGTVSPSCNHGPNGI